MKFGGGGRRFAAKWTKDADGISHPSKGEAHWWDRLRLRERAREIFRLEREPRFDLYVAKDCPHCREHGVRIGFAKIDAAFDDAQGVRHFQDHKGIEGETPLSKFKRRFVEARFGIKIEIVGPAAQRTAREKARADLAKRSVESAGKS